MKKNKKKREEEKEARKIKGIYICISTTIAPDPIKKKKYIAHVIIIQ